MEMIDENGFDMSWLSAFIDTNTYDFITITLSFITLISFLLYRKSTGNKQKQLKIVSLCFITIFVMWMLKGKLFK